MLNRLMLKSVALMLMSSISLIAFAIADPKQLDIPAGNLIPALEALAKQAAIEIVYQPDQLRAFRTQGVKGTYEPKEAVRILLKGTPLELRVDPSGAMAIVPAHITSGATTRSLRSQDPDPGESHSAAPLVLNQAAGQSAEQPTQPGTLEQRPKSDQLQQVVVTATKRAENIQDVPFSITAITADDIDRRGLVGEQDYLRGIPGVNQLENPNGGAIVIRGIDTGPEFQNYYVGATVATYFGEAQTTTSAGTNVNANIDLKLVDIERVEVLRGPQGTAFGDAALAGAVRTIPNPPQLNTLEGKFSAGYSETSGPGAHNYSFQGVANIPLVEDRLAIRAVAYVSTGFQS